MSERYSHQPTTRELTIEARVDAIIDLIGKGYQAAEICKQLGPYSKRRYGKGDNSVEIGKNTEKRVLELLSRHHLVQGLEKTPDSQEAIDAIVLFKSEFTIPNLPLQIKSSESGIDQFFNSKAYERAAMTYPHILVINGGPGATNLQIYEQFEHQLEEFGYLLEGNTNSLDNT